MTKQEFVAKCGELLQAAKPNLISAEYRLGRDMPKSKFETYMPDDEFVLITCENGYTYAILITGDSLSAIAQDIFNKMAHK